MLRGLPPALLLLPAAVWASHPLITEDAGVLDAGMRQVELHGERAEKALALSYGVGGSAELQVEWPYVRREGWSDPVFSVKWRFYDRGGLQAVLKPEVQDKSWTLNLAAGKALGRFQLLGHAGYTRNRDSAGERGSLRHASAALLYGATERVHLVLDAARDTNPDPGAGAAVRRIVFGATYAPSSAIDLGLGLQHAANDPAGDRTLRAGIKLRF
jgi:hypothetical protein